MVCRAELVQLEKHRSEIEALDVELVVLAAEQPATLSDLATRHDLGARLLADPDAKALRQLDLAHPGGGPGGKDIALPTQLLIDREGRVLWSFRSTDTRERVSIDELLAVLREAPSS